MDPPTAPQQQKGPEQNDPPSAPADSTGRGETSHPAAPPPTQFLPPALEEAWKSFTEGSTTTSFPLSTSRSPQKQQMAAEGDAVTRVTRHQSKKDNTSSDGGGGGVTRGRGARARAAQSKVGGGGSARAPAGQLEDNSGSCVVKGAVATMTPTRKLNKANSGGGGGANDDEGGRRTMKKPLGVPLNDNSGGGGARGRGAKGVIVAAAKGKRARANDVEAGGKRPNKKKLGRTLPLKRDTPPSTSVDDVLGGEASAAVASDAAQVAAPEAPPDTCAPCTWSFFKPCHFLLPPPMTCNKCSAAVHHVCQIIWENAHSYESPGCARYCPLHHPHYQELVTAGGGKRSSEKSATSLFMISAAAATAANRAAQAQELRHYQTATPAPPKQAPPLFEVSRFTLQSSPAESTLTPTHTQHPQAAAHVPVDMDLFPVTDNRIDSNTDEYEIAIANELNDILEFDQNHEEKMSGNFVINPGDDNDEFEDLDEDGRGEDNGGDSDEEGEEADVHNIALARRLISDDECEEIFTKSDAERIALSRGMTGICLGDDPEIDDDIGEPTSRADEELNLTSLIGAPLGWLPPSAPLSFPGYRPKSGDPPEEDIDNPGGWSMFTFTPSYHQKTKKYDGHTTPSGAHVVPPDELGNRVMDGWEFHYKNWKANEFDENTYARKGAKFGDLKPQSRRGCLDANVLRKHGLTAERMRTDPLFFYQLLFPFCAPADSGVADDHRMPFYSNVSVFTNMYAMWKGAGSGYGHDFTPVSIPELVHWAGVPLRNGALDGKPATLFHRWKEHDPRYDPIIAENIKLSRWRQIKRYFKLSMGMEEKKRGDVGYDPCVKYDYIYRCLVHNMNYVTEFADLDNTIDETTWGFSGYSGDAGWRLMNKPKSKGDVMSCLNKCLLHVSFCLRLTCPVVQKEVKLRL